MLSLWDEDGTFRVLRESPLLARSVVQDADSGSRPPRVAVLRVPRRAGLPTQQGVPVNASHYSIKCGASGRLAGSRPLRTESITARCAFSTSVRTLVGVSPENRSKSWI